MSNPGKFYIGSKVDTFDVAPVAGNVVKVVIWIDETNYVQSPATGDVGEGITVEVDCPYATQAIADQILTQLQTHNYSPYSASNAILNPAAELGDGITSNGIYSGIYSMSKSFGHDSCTDISAPINMESEHEFQYVTEQDRRFTRQVAKIGSELALKMDSIYAKVVEGVGEFGWELTSTGMSWKSNGSEVMKLDSSGLTINGQLNAHTIITGYLEIGGQSVTTTMTADTLGIGAQDGYDWSNVITQEYGGVGYTGAGYSLGGGLGGFHYGSATSSKTTSVYPAYFKADYINAVSTFVYRGNAGYWQKIDLPNGTSYTVLCKES